MTNSMAMEQPVLLETDVAVIGGGPAGMAAAVAAARAGAQVAVVERWPALGGLATAAMVTFWHTSDRTREVILGFTHELVERLERYGGVVRYPGFPLHHETYLFSPEWLKLVYDDLIREEKIRCLCYTPCVAARTEGRQIRAAVVGTKQGLREIRAQRWIDASGDGDLAAFAGARFTAGSDGGQFQGMTLVSRYSGIDMSDRKRIAQGDRACRQMLADLQAKGAAPPTGPHSFEGHFVTPWHGSLLLCTSGNPLDNEDLTRATMEARRKLPFFVHFFRKHLPGCEKLDIDQTGFCLGIREARHVAGLYTFTGEDIVRRRSFPDAIGQGFWMVDIHDPAGTGRTTWSEKDRHLKAGTTYQIPYRIVVSADFDNLFIPGRCASATHEGMAGLRIQSHCHIMGQAAGLAAAMSLESNCAPAEVDVAALQRQLRAANVYIEENR